MRISYDEYLAAIEKVNTFHLQTRNDFIETAFADGNFQEGNINEPILILLRRCANKRIVNAVTSFLVSETAYGKIPFSSPEIVTTTFFVERYHQQELKKIWSLGSGSLKTLTKILKDNGHIISY